MRMNCQSSYVLFRSMTMATCISILIIISGCTSTPGPPNEEKGISAIKQYSIALNISKEWKNDSTLAESNGLCGGTKERITIWGYSFFSPSSAHQIDNGTVYEWFKVIISANGTPSLIDNGTSIGSSTIINWTIDSVEALKIINNVPEMKRYIRSEGVLLEGFTLFPRSHFSKLNNITGIDNDDSVWYGKWMRSPIAGSPDTPMMKEIWINAHDGTVLRIDVNGG